MDVVLFDFNSDNKSLAAYQLNGTISGNRKAGCVIDSSSQDDFDEEEWSYSFSFGRS